MTPAWPPYKKLCRRARRLVRHGRFFYLLALAVCVFSAYRAFTKSAWLVAVVAAAVRVLAYRKLQTAPKRQQSLATASFTGNPFSDPGTFTYSSAGFAVATSTGFQSVAWADINALFGYKVDAYIIDRIQLDLFHAQGYLYLTEELPGWHVFLARLAERCPLIEPHWEIAIATPAFATNLTLLYDRQGQSLSQAQAFYYCVTT